MFQDPPPFPAEEPAFIEELRGRSGSRVQWDMALCPERNEADFRSGLVLEMEFPDPGRLLETVELDFCRFLDGTGMRKAGAAPVAARKAEDLRGEDFRLAVTPDSIVVEAGDTEGIRRGLYFLMDLLEGSRAPFLPLGISMHQCWLKNRISRCFFGPIKRPPFNRDELMDEIDYYPEEYLSRLAREGVNGLWLTVVFREVCTTSLYPRDPDAEKRLEKLRRTVEKCRRYGIRIWVFCIEPACWKAGSNPCPSEHPELKGPKGYSGTSFCPVSETARNYLFECTYSLFSAVPELGGLITISHGERITSCLSTLSVFGENEAPCGRCGLGVGEILAKTLRPLADGMLKAAPDAELISWLYMPYPEQLAEWVYRLPEKLTKDIILVCNFESGCSRRQLGRIRTGGDYWLSCIGPGDRFGRMAQAARGHCSIGAKLQVCCSHEVASVPFVPVPGQLYRKYREMKRLGVEHVIQCWYFGNYPGLMNRCAGYLAYENFDGTEEQFLERLAYRDWGKYASRMASVWKMFSDAYSHYPLDIQFQYYGPMHDGPVWPLHLKQVLRCLPRSWKPDPAPAGDVVGEFMFNHELRETALLVRRLSDGWHRGMKLFETFRRDCMDCSGRRSDAALMDALEIQFRSGANILEFYVLRNRLMDDPSDALQLLRRLEEIVKEEIGHSRSLAELCRLDPRLGYHSEAEVYKYFPAKLRWRAEWLERSLATEFAECREILRSGVPVSEFLLRQSPLHETGRVYENGTVRWKVETDVKEVRIAVECLTGQDAVSEESLKFFLLDWKGERTPWMALRVNRRGESYDFFSCAQFCVEEHGTSWRAVLEIPRLMLDRDRIWFGFLHEWKTPDGTVHMERCPSGDFPEEPRLNLDFFVPERLLLLELTSGRRIGTVAVAKEHEEGLRKKS